MTKRIPFLIVGVLVLSGLGAAVVPGLSESSVSKDVTTVLFSEPVLHEQENYLTVDLKEATSSLADPGKPCLPVVAKVFTYPVGTRIQNVEVVFSDREEQVISKRIFPVRTPVPLLSEGVTISELTEDMTVYGSTRLYPETSWSYSIGVGLKDTTTVVYLSVWLNPVQYSPANEKLFIAKNAQITVSSFPPSDSPSPVADAYDLLIVAPAAFSEPLQPLIDHKNTHGVSTILKTTEDIYVQYTAGRDDQEKIKFCIYDMKETYNITYVLLVGGRVGQRLKWYLPERLTNNDDGWEAGYASDLYYADVYKYNETSGLNEFEDWDSNHNGIFAEWSTIISKRDTIDYIPDVYLGRLACISEKEVVTVVEKITTYEGSAADPTWFTKMICVAGDTFVPGINGDHSGVPEGEVECDHSSGILEPLGFSITKLYTSDGSFNGPAVVNSAITEGAGFVHFAGHGNPSTWGTHAPESDNFTTGLTIFQMWKLRNKEKLPIVVVGGCHNSQFNVTVLNLLIGFLTDGFKYFQFKDEPLGKFWRKEWVPECWSWWLIRLKNGGSIATIGCTGLGYGDFAYHTLDHYGGWIEGRFFDAYGNQSKHILGQAHGQALIDYVTIIGGVNSAQLDRKTVEEWCLLGDPSLMIGGYS